MGPLLVRGPWGARGLETSPPGMLLTGYRELFATYVAVAVMEGRRPDWRKMEAGYRRNTISNDLVEIGEGWHTL